MQPLQNPPLCSNTKIEQDISRILMKNKVSVLGTFLSFFRREGGSLFRREGGSIFRREGGSLFRREGGSLFGREGGLFSLFCISL